MVAIVIALLPIVSKNSLALIISLIIAVLIYSLFIVYYKSIIKGKIGEFITQKVIESYCTKRGYSYLHDIMIYNDEIVTSQIDHVIVTRRGIAVIETKYHEGIIYGSEYANHWTY